MVDVQAVAVHNGVPAAPAGATQHTREVQAPSPAPAGVPPVPAHAVQNAGERPQGTPRQVDSAAEFQATQPVTPALDPRLTALLQAEQQRKDPVANQPVEKPDVTKPDTPQGGLNDLDLSSLDDPQLRSLGELLVASAPNLDIERALGKAIQYMNPDLIDSRYIQEAGGASAKALLNLATTIVNTAKVQGEATVNAIYQGAGGEQNWQAAVALFNKNAPLHMRQVAADLLDSKNTTKVKSGAQFVLEYANQNGGLANAPQYQNANSARGDASQALDKKGFQTALMKLVPEHQNPNYAADRAELYRRRELGRQLGR